MSQKFEKMLEHHSQNSETRISNVIIITIICKVTASPKPGKAWMEV